MTDSSAHENGATEQSSQAKSTPRPRPTPRPGKPGVPKPGPAAGHAATPISTPSASDPSKFGRVDDDGTAWVITAEGERQIGSWQAGDAAEGLAHFGRRYDDLATEVSLLEARLATGSGDARKTRSAAIALDESLPTATVIGDIDGLAVRLKAIIAGSAEAEAAAIQEQEQTRQAGTTRKEELAAEAETIAGGSDQWKAAGDRLREILDEWKSIRGVDRKTDDVLWRRYSKARETFNRRRGAHFAELDRERLTAKGQKEELVERAEALQNNTDWAPTAGAFRDLLSEWKAVGRAPRDTDDVLWKRFKNAQDVFFAARAAAASERDAEFGENAAAKEALLVEAEAIDLSGNLDAARAALRDIQQKWDDLGKVPRERVQELEGRLRAVEKQVRDAADDQWRRTDPETLARVAQFRERVAQFEEQAAKAAAAGKTKDADKALAQAQQWREWAEAAEGAVNG